MEPDRFPVKEDLTNKEFDRWTVESYAGRDVAAPGRLGPHMWVCVCACGRRRAVHDCRLRGGRSRSCGYCTRQHALTHGHSRGRPTGKTPEYRAWSTMCQTAKKLGLEVDPQWLGPTGFVTWLSDMGSRPSPGHRLFRRDKSRIFQKDNLHWVEARKGPYTYRGKTLSLKEWSHETGISLNILTHRLQDGWTLAKALRTPPRDPDVKFVFYRGDKVELVPLARSWNLTSQMVRRRIRSGWTVERAVETPAFPNGRKRAVDSESVEAALVERSA